MSCWRSKLAVPAVAVFATLTTGLVRGADAGPGVSEQQPAAGQPEFKNRQSAESHSTTLDGKVINAASQEPVVSFRLLSAGMDEDGKIRWRRERVYRGRNGAFSVNPSDFGSRPVFLRVEADGYEPAFSDRLDGKDSEIRSFEFRLKKSGPIRGKVTLPDGEAGYSATVVLCTEFSAPVLSPNLFQRSPQYASQRTGDRGQFTFAPEPEALRVAAVHADGYGEALLAPSGETTTVALEAWGAVEGTVRSWTTAQPEPGMVAVLTPDATIPSLFTRLGLVVLDGAKFTVETGENGGFTLTNIPPGERFLWHSVPFTSSVDAGGVSFVGQSIRIKPGETNKVVAGANPGVILGQLMDAPGKPYEAGHRALGFLSLKAVSAGASQPRLTVTFGADGKFAVDDLAPGDYEAGLDVYCPPILVGSVKRKLSIATPEKTPATAPLDTGSWILTPSATAKVGEAAPDFELPTLGGGKIRLSQYRGKFILLHFWATWASPRFAMLPGLKKCVETKLPQFVMIGLNLDHDAALAANYAAKTGMTWPQGRLGEWSQARLPGLYGASIPSACLISPEGKILAMDIDFTTMPECFRELMQ